MHFFKGLTVLLVVVLMVHAAFTQWYEVDYMRVVSPILILSFAFLLVAFLMRKSWSWVYVAQLVVVEIVINLVFWPEHEFFGEFLFFARVLIGTEVALFAILGGFMLLPITRRWFRGITSI